MIDANSWKKRSKVFQRSQINHVVWKVKTSKIIPQAFSKFETAGVFPNIFLLPLFGGKNSMFNWVSKLNPLSFIISVTHIPLELSRFYFPNTVSNRKALQRRIYFQCFLLWKCVFQQSSKCRGEKCLQPFLNHHGDALSVTNQNKQYL